jgi:alkanesulfonate monooxygenase SsuD/methylene tetrahydromethanopterin reductase-like flavin-dependent oxidoreductase (luciferase family)
MHALIIPYREPIITAKILATLDALSGGRLTLGAGAGWMEEEFAALGLSNFAERGAITNEYLLLFKELWTKENPEFHGKYVKVSDVGFLPKPLQRPHPPIWIGGHSPAGLAVSRIKRPTGSGIGRRHVPARDKIRRSAAPGS